VASAKRRGSAEPNKKERARGPLLIKINHEFEA
jgi:hypothetical protein